MFLFHIHSGASLPRDIATGVASEAGHKVPAKLTINMQDQRQEAGSETGPRAKKKKEKKKLCYGPLLATSAFGALSSAEKCFSSPLRSPSALSSPISCLFLPPSVLVAVRGPSHRPRPLYFPSVRSLSRRFGGRTRSSQRRSPVLNKSQSGFARLECLPLIVRLHIASRKDREASYVLPLSLFYLRAVRMLACTAGLATLALLVSSLSHHRRKNKAAVESSVFCCLLIQFVL